MLNRKIRRWKKLAAVLAAGAMLFSGITVLAQENEISEGSPVQVQADESTEMIDIDLYISYVNSENKYVEVNDSIQVTEGSTYQDAIDLVLETFQNEPFDNMTTTYNFQNWTCMFYGMEDEVIPAGNPQPLNFFAVYDQKLVADGTQYYDTQGNYKELADREVVAVPEGTTSEEAAQMLWGDGQVPDDMYNGLRLSGWVDYTGSDPVRDWVTVIPRYAQYENSLVRFMVVSDYEQSVNAGTSRASRQELAESVQYMLVENGETISLPQSFDGYDSIVWRDVWQYAASGNSYEAITGTEFTVQGCCDFVATGVKSGAEPSDPSEPVVTDTPDNPDPAVPDDPSDTEGNDNPEKVTTDKPTVLINVSSSAQAPKTGDTMNMIIYSVLILAAVNIIVVSYRKKA